MPPETNTVRLGDCLDVLQELPDNCIDLICTDPPYGLTSVDPKKPGGGSGTTGFMNKEWDAAVPSVDVWCTCLRILRPGAFAFIMSSPRQDCTARMILNLEEAGFVTGFTSIYWVYAQGFNKGGNLSKIADKRAGAEREVVGLSGRVIKKKGAKATSYHGTSTFAESDEAREKSRYTTAPATDEAKMLNGAYGGFQPKPSIEPILVVMKPLSEKTFLDQALTNGKGCTWMDDCRIPTEDSLAGGTYAKNPTARWDGTKSWRFKRGATTAGEFVQPEGRFPANVLIEDDMMNDGVVRSSCRSTKKHKAYKGKSTTGLMRGESSPDNQYADSGSASRYFDLDAWFLKWVGELPKEVQRVFPNLLVSKPSKREKNAGLDEPSIHPTVKPTKLFSYLLTLGSRRGDVVLDPYLGSGTTGIAAIALKRRFIGIEREEDYVEIAVRRIKYAKKQVKKAMKRLFD